MARAAAPRVDVQFAPKRPAPKARAPKVDHRPKIPRWALYGMLAMALGSIVAAAAGRYAGVGELRVAPLTPVASRTLSFDVSDAGAVAVRAVEAGGVEGRALATLGQEDSGFIRGVLRSLERERRMRGLSEPGIYELTRGESGRVEIRDPETGARVLLNGFGADNLEAFARLLTLGRTPG